MKAETIIAMSVQQMVCTACGSEVNATCNCGKPYVPKKQRAAEAIAANPQKSDRAIAEETGASRETVRKARAESGDNQLSPEREGRDGKTYHIQPREPDDEDEDIEADVEPENYRGAFLMRADVARQMAVYSGPIDEDVIGLAKNAAAAWQLLANKLDEPEQYDSEHEEGLRVIAARGFLNRAQEAKDIATLGKLQASDITEAMIGAARATADAWARVVQELERKHSRSHGGGHDN